MPLALRDCIVKHGLENTVCVYTGSSSCLLSGGNLTPGLESSQFAYDIFLKCVSLPTKIKTKKNKFTICTHGAKAVMWRKRKETQGKRMPSYLITIFDPNHTKKVTCTLPELLQVMPKWKGCQKCAVQTTGKAMPALPASLAFILLRYAVSLHSAEKDALTRCIDTYCFKSGPRNRARIDQHDAWVCLVATIFCNPTM